ncbi:MAG TPA: SDR family oxidoreductase [Anaerolineae bacterium]|nr:SDR family oxidoreductase [Anaerolineae bacterium]
MDLSGKTALITGGAHRIGRGLALALARAGCNLILHYNRSADRAQATAEEARALGVQVILRRADLSRLDDPTPLFTNLPHDVAPVQILVNSAAIFPKDTLTDFTLDGWSQTLRINLRAPVLLTQAFARALPDDLQGAVVNITDWRTERPYRTHFTYTVSKGALDTFTRAAAIQLAPRIRVNAIALGAMLPPEGASEAYWQRVLATVPLARAGGTESAAHTLLYLLRNDFITGEIIRLTGGAHLNM